MKKQFIYILTLFTCISLTGCGINADIEPMTYSYHSSKKPHKADLLHSISIGAVAGGHAINPMMASDISNESFKVALQKSFENSRLLAGKSDNFQLDAQIVRLERPVVGLDFTSNLSVQYQLKDVKTHKTLYEKKIVSTYTAKLKDCLIAVKRLKLANEGAARENIKQLIADLYKI